MNTKHTYLSFCEENQNLPIFFQPFWLDVVYGSKQWEVCLAFNKNQEITGVLPYFLDTYFGFPVVKMPPLTPYQGVWLNYPDNLKKQHALHTFQKRVSSELMNQLPNCQYYAQRYPPTFKNWHPFHQKGYHQTTRYTYIIPNIKNHNRVFQDFHPKVRNRIRVAEKEGIEISTIDDLSLFYEINHLIFKAKKQAIPYSYTFLKNLDKKLVEQGRRMIFCAQDQQEDILAVGYFVWDNKYAYYLAGGANPEFSNLHALSLLLWQAIQDLSERVEHFDFEGSMLPEVEHFFRAFGGTLTPYYKISRASNIFTKTALLLLR